MQRYAAWMTYMSWVSLGEGGTSCTNFSSLAHELGVAAIHIKNEGQHPSGTHKDRMSCLAVTRALDVGATMIDRKSVEYGKSVAVRVDLGGRRIIKKKYAVLYYVTK